MICQTIQNGGIILILLLCFNKSISTTEEHSFAVQEYCSGDRILKNIEPDSDLILHLNSGSSATINKWFHKSKRKCRKEFKTSDSAAHLEVLITNINIPESESCGDCRCNYFEIWTLHGHSKRFCGKREDTFSSKTDTLTIDFHPSLNLHPSLLFDVTLKFSAKRNFYIITGTYSDALVSSIFVETPYFPSKYPPYYKADYLLQCDVHSYVMLLFLDFQVSPQSFIEVVGANGTHPKRFYGHEFRPSVTVSQSDSLTLKFESNNQEGMPGFRAEFSCIKSKDRLYVPFTDCGGQSPGREGLINIPTHAGFALYDCIWHITASIPLSIKSFLSVFIHMKSISHKSSLVFRKGYDSKSEIVKYIDCEKQKCSTVDEEVKVLASDDLYIRFHGYLDELSIVNMSYSTYHLENCSSTEFRCSDNRCLQPDFRCDGVKQCPDGLDEYTCPSTQVSGDRNSSAPSVISGHRIGLDVQPAFVAFLLFGTLGLVIVIVTFIFVKKYCSRAAASDQLLPQSVDELSNLPPATYPVTYDNDSPPTYEDYIKSSDNYPPILFVRANQCSDTNSTHCTTSFCTGARARHHSADSFNVRSSDSGSDIFLNIAGEDSNPTHPSPLSDRCNIEISQRITFNSPANNLKRSHSLDSKLSDQTKKDYNFSLSITQPVCAHMFNHHSHPPQCCTLPPNFKPKEFQAEGKKDLKSSPSLRLDSNVTFQRDRRLTWSFGPNRSFGPEIVTVVKTRCFSDPCNGISVHYSLY